MPCEATAERSRPRPSRGRHAADDLTYPSTFWLCGSVGALRVGGFDHVAVHAASGHVYVANTVNDAVDVFDPTSQRHLYSVPQLRGVAGVLVSDEAQLIISSNRGENTIGIFPPGPEPQVSKVACPA